MISQGPNLVILSNLSTEDTQTKPDQKVIGVKVVRSQRDVLVVISFQMYRDKQSEQASFQDEIKTEQTDNER